MKIKPTTQIDIRIKLMDHLGHDFPCTLLKRIAHIRKDGKSKLSSEKTAHE